MASTRTVIPGSERTAPKATLIGGCDPNETAVISIYLKRPTSPAVAAEAEIPVVRDRAELRRERESALSAQMDKIAAFAVQEGLTVVAREPARRLIQVSGKLQTLAAAFGAHLQMFSHAQGAVGGAFRARTGVLTAPSDVADLVEAVLGLDQRPVARPRSVRVVSPRATQGYLPNDVTRLYGFPTTLGAGKGVCIAIIELGGGVAPEDTSTAFRAMGLTPPEVTPVLVSGGTNQPGVDPDSDGEVALDVQVCGAGAPGANLAVYFAPNTDQGFVDAITQAAQDETHKPSVMSISWGSPESDWTAQAIAAMTSAFQDAVAVGVSVFAASGDGLATDGLSDGKAHVDFPASSPWVVGCGGASITVTGAAITDETVWNSDGGGSGGGVSSLFPRPAYQANIKLPAGPGGAAQTGRGVPDVAGDADPQTGYRVVVDGQTEVIGGTSAVAPLWAGLFALINVMAGKPLGQPHAVLYANPAAFNDIRAGNNISNGIGYSAGPGWDACTGLGSPKGSAIGALFKAKA
jgi:kumamolisin